MNDRRRIAEMRRNTWGAVHRVYCGPQGADLAITNERALAAPLGAGPSLTLEVRATGDDQGFGIVGHAAVYGRLSEPLGGFREVLAPGAFRRVLDEGPDVGLLIDHDPSTILARTTSGTLSLEEDAEGLAVNADAALTTRGRDLRLSMKRGDVNAMSFGFTVREDDWEINDAGVVIRTVHEIGKLWDVSVVTFPAYPQTDASARTLDEDEKIDDGATGASDRRGDPRRFAAWWRAQLHDLTSNTEGART